MRNIKQRLMSIMRSPTVLRVVFSAVLTMGILPSPVAWAGDPQFHHFRGPYPIGHTQRVFYDKSRLPILKSTNQKAGMEVAVDIWYPAIKGSGPATQYSPTYPVDRLPYFSSGLDNICVNGTCLPKSIYKGLVNSPNGAKENLSVSSSRFPVILYHPGFGGLGNEQYQLSEVLASHGFIVVGVWTADDSLPDALKAQYAPERFNNGYLTWFNGIIENGVFAPFDGTNENLFKVFTTGADARALNIQFMVTQMINLGKTNGQGKVSFFDKINSGAIGTMGFSLGACAAVEAASGVASRNIPADSRIKAILPMELCRIDIITVPGISKGSFNEGDPVGMDGVTIPDSDLKKVKAPILWIQQTDPDPYYGGESAQMGRVLDLTQGRDKYHIMLKDAIHVSITTNSLCAQSMAALDLFSDTATANDYTIWDAYYSGFNFDNEYYNFSQPFTPGVNIPNLFPGVCGFPSQSNYQELLANFLPIYTQIDNLINSTVFGFTESPNFDLPNAIPPQKWPIVMDAATSEQIKATYAVSFFTKYLKNDSKFDFFLTPLFAWIFEPQLLLYETCLGKAGCTSVNPSEGRK